MVRKEKSNAEKKGGLEECRGRLVLLRIQGAALYLAALSAALLEALLVLPLVLVVPHCCSTAAKSLSSMSWPPMPLPVITSFVHCSALLPEALK